MLRLAKPFWIAASCALIFITVGAAVFAVKHYEPTKQHAEQEAKNQGEGKVIEILASERVAYYTKVLAIFTGVLAAVSFVQGIFLIRADNTARLSAEALPRMERAYVFLAENVELDEINRDGIYVMAKVQYPFKNHGRTPAILKEIHVASGFWRSSLPTMAAAIGGAIPDGLVLSAGEESRQFGCLMKTTVTDWDEAKDGGGYIAFFGRIIYTDVFGERHETGFCREYNFSRNRFVLAPNDQLNYYT